VTPLAKISRDLSKKVDALSFGGDVAYVYNPLDYARVPHEAYLDRWGRGPKEVLFLGMNPGPFGMAQNGVPFGDTVLVRDFLDIRGPVTRPSREHPKRPVLGFDCKRSEVSGTRLWGFARDHFKSPERFFERFFVVNYCPLVFMDEGGRNITPDKLSADERAPLLEHCDDALRKTVRLLTPRWVIGVGAFAEKQAARALQGLDVQVGTILHPSPASPRANRGWAEEVTRQLGALGLIDA
jgi:single-strand selective monofunctional uracil DNA glycosylase